jgi:hypothetical protein
MEELKDKGERWGSGVRKENWEGSEQKHPRG